mgnify:CR=1 FL=1
MQRVGGRVSPCGFPKAASWPPLDTLHRPLWALHGGAPVFVGVLVKGGRHSLRTPACQSTAIKRRDLRGFFSVSQARVALRQCGSDRLVASSRRRYPAFYGSGLYVTRQDRPVRLGNRSPDTRTATGTPLTARPAAFSVKIRMGVPVPPKVGCGELAKQRA